MAEMTEGEKANQQILRALIAEEMGKLMEENREKIVQRAQKRLLCGDLPKPAKGE